MIDIIKKENCCGCSACSQICAKNAVTMKSDSEGFLYPEVNRELCTDCGLCDKVCPIINKEADTPKPQKAYLVQNKNKKVLKESTSGGAFTAIAEYVIRHEGVVFGVAYDRNFRAVHTEVSSSDELKKFRNSKYVQSNPCNTFRKVKDYLNSGKLVCYSGTPCQIEGLKSFLLKDYKNLITVDVVCRAVPSPMIWEKYKKFIAGENKITGAKFRDKRHYGYDYSQMTVTTKQGHYHAGVESDPYLRAFFTNLSDRPSCYECQFKKRYRVSDITIWDCFEPQKFDKRLDNNSGATRVLVHSGKGAELMKNILDNFVFTEVSADDIVSGVREMFHSVPYNPNRNKFFADAVSMNEHDFFMKWFPDNLKVKTERIIRHTAEKLGIYRFVKRTAKKALKLIKH